MKIKLGKKNCLYPMPAVLVGVKIAGRPNFITIAHVGIMDLSTISISVKKEHYSRVGIEKAGVFSVNIPSEELVKEVDFCGMVSGERTDKSTMFDVVDGDATGAPLISRCPLSMECRVLDMLTFSDHDVFIGGIVETYCDEGVLAEGEVDVSKLRPLLFFMDSRGYYGVGGRIADAWSVGEELIGGEGG